MSHAREALQAIYDQHGELTPELVLKAARSKTSALHRFFTWDKDDAADKWLLHQAHTLIQRVKIRVRTSPDETIRVRAFVHAPDRGYYIPTDEALTSASRDVVLEQALREIEALCRKYQHLIDWDAVLNAVLERAA